MSSLTLKLSISWIVFLIIFTKLNIELFSLDLMTSLSVTEKFLLQKKNNNNNNKTMASSLL